MKKIILPLFIAGSLSACSLAPYEEDFACRKKDQLGKCISMQQAYEEAVTGEEIYPPMKPASEQDSENINNSLPLENGKSNSHGNLAYDRYVNSYYNEISSLVDKPVTPMVKQAKTVRTLILPYSNSSDNSLYMERYIYSIVEENQFVLGQYLMKMPQPVEPLINTETK
ncbi:type IV conjugative transfer system lipoprotein TraV [Pseudoalteromonas galatheae]|uniref:type IV conjugative transfer system lipoprotein TraV n=1 Tax=Pseudoalteromonas galatheae TaxID=579562 RepID=UPI0030CF4754